MLFSSADPAPMLGRDASRCSFSEGREKLVDASMMSELSCHAISRAVGTQLLLMAG